MAIKKDEFTQSIQSYIKEGIAKETAKIADTYKDQIVKDVEYAISDIVAKVSVRLARFYRIEDLTHEVRITIQKEFVPIKSTPLKGKKQ